MLTPQLKKERAEQGGKTIFYTCCGPQKPNTFTFSPPAEAEWLPLFAAANHLDGYSRWAYNSWNRNPFECTDFGTWPSGDCFLVYPGNLSSIRFERMRDGIEEYEKVRILRERGNTDALDKTLKDIFTLKNASGNGHAQDVQRAKEAIRIGI